MFDVIVVGAGPGGTTAAILMAKSGLNVVLLDKATFPRDKVCGDAVSGKCLDVLKSLELSDLGNLESAQVTSGITFSSPSGDLVSIPFGRDSLSDVPSGFVCTREQFDDYLFQAALSAGVTAIQGATVTSLIKSGTSVSGVRANINDAKVLPPSVPVVNGQAVFQAPIVIGADGAQSVVARELGMKQLVEQHYATGVRGYYSGVTGFNEGNYIELHFVEETIPGYFWVFPLANGLSNVGIGMPTAALKKNRVQLKSLLTTLTNHPRFKHRFESAELLGPVTGWGLPLGSKPRKMAGEGWMLVGDAASLIDPFTGEGIGNAMHSGVLAAEYASMAHAKGVFSRAVLGGFEKAVLDMLEQELRLSHLLTKLVRWNWLLNLVIRKASRSKEVSEAVTNMFASVDQRKKLTSPLFYFKLLFA